MRLEFDGWWDDEEKRELDGEPWERFVVLLHGTEAGETCSPDDVEDILRVSGYRIVIEKIDD